MPAMMAAEVKKFASSGASAMERSTTSSGKPSDWMRMRPSAVGLAIARMSRFTEAAMTRPWLWSVWFPEISERPPTE